MALPKNRVVSAIINMGRILTLHPPFRPGQLQTLLTMKQLAYGDHTLKRLSGYCSPWYPTWWRQFIRFPSCCPLRRSIRTSSWSGNIPAFVHLDFDKLCGGKYDWNHVKQLLIEECGWVPPADDKKSLHTSCRIEKCKDYSQFIRFYHCKSKMIPFSSL